MKTLSQIKETFRKSGYPEDTIYPLVVGYLNSQRQHLHRELTQANKTIEQLKQQLEELDKPEPPRKMFKAGIQTTDS